MNNKMSPYERLYSKMMAEMNDKQKEDFKKAHEWLDEHWKEYTDSPCLDYYDFYEAPDDKEEIYRNDSFQILYAYAYEYFEVLLLSHRKE